MTLTLDSTLTTDHTADFEMTTPFAPASEPDLPTPAELAALDREIAITGAHLASIHTSARALLAALPGATVSEGTVADDAHRNRMILSAVAAITDTDDTELEPVARVLPDPEPLRVRQPDTSRDLPAIAAHHPAGFERLEAMRAASTARMFALLPELVEIAQAEIDIADETAALATAAAGLFPGVGDPQARAMDALVPHLDRDNPALTIAEAIEFPHVRYLDALKALVQNGATP